MTGYQICQRKYGVFLGTVLWTLERMLYRAVIDSIPMTAAAQCSSFRLILSGVSMQY